MTSDRDIAIIGLAGCFPKAKDVNVFWKNLLKGKDCLTHFTDEELHAQGIAASGIANKNYIKVKGIIDNPFDFDASFFKFSSQEAIAIDPQKRLLLHTAWHALTDAGLAENSRGQKIGVFVSGSRNTYFDHHLVHNTQLQKMMGAFKLMGLNDIDSLATTLSYKLDLHGPSLTIQSACSSALAALHTACLSLYNGECDYSLTGGVALQFPHKSGYLFEEGSILSASGKCRAFDQDADGTVDGSGAGMVVLCRLSDALKNNIPVRAIIAGSALNNDGGQKMSIAAPCVEGQRAVIKAALKNGQCK